MEPRSGEHGSPLFLVAHGSPLFLVAHGSPVFLVARAVHHDATGTHPEAYPDELTLA